MTDRALETFRMMFFYKALFPNQIDIFAIRVYNGEK